MDQFFRQYYILKSMGDRQKRVVIKAETLDAVVKLKLSFDKREHNKDKLTLVGIDNNNNVRVKKRLTSDDIIKVKLHEFVRINHFFMINENDKDIILSYIENENKDQALRAFETYRFNALSIKTKMAAKPKTINHKQETNTPKRQTKQENKPKQENETNETRQSNDMAGMLKNFQQATSMFSAMNKMNIDNKPKQPIKGMDEKEKKNPTFNPFKTAFPNSEWIKTQYQSRSGFWHYISGKIYQNNELKFKAIGVPGEYAMTPPSWLEGFNKYYVSESAIAKGYWVMFLDPETGTVVDIDKKN